MKYFFISILVLLLVLFSKLLLAQDKMASPEQQAREILEGPILNGQCAGITAGIFRAERIVWMEGAGYRDIENEIPADTNTLHRIASISKPMTAIAIMQLVEAKKVDLDAPIQKYLPDFPKKKKGVITIRHLLSHSSGIKDYQGEAEAFPQKHYSTLHEAIKVFKDRKLQFKPGQKFAYTTYNYVVLGAVIEAVTKQSYETYMQENIWESAGMTNTSVEWAGQSYANKAKLYQQSKSGSFEAALPTDLSLKIPGGGLQSTIGDLLRFGRAVCNNQLISRASLEVLIKPSGLKEEGNPYAMGWYIYGTQDSPNGWVIGHSGGQSGTGAQLAIFLDAGVVVAGFSNTSVSWNEIVQMVFQLAGMSKRLE